MFLKASDVYLSRWNHLRYLFIDLAKALFYLQGKKKMDLIELLQNIAVQYY